MSRQSLGWRCCKIGVARLEQLADGSLTHMKGRTAIRVERRPSSQSRSLGLRRYRCVLWRAA